MIGDDFLSRFEGLKVSREIFAWFAIKLSMELENGCAIGSCDYFGVSW
jgi:hypothetical protein